MEFDTMLIQTQRSEIVKELLDRIKNSDISAKEKFILIEYAQSKLKLLEERYVRMHKY